MKLAVCLVLLFSTSVLWAEDTGPTDGAPQPTGSDAAAPPQPVPTDGAAKPWRFSLDVGVLTGLLVPILGSENTFTTGEFSGVDLATPLPDHRWHARTAIEVGTTTAQDQRIFLGSITPGLSYDAFFGPTAFMTFLVEGGWISAAASNLAVKAELLSAGAGTSVSFYLGDYVNFRTDLRYVEVFGAAHLVTLAIAFDVIGK